MSIFELTQVLRDIATKLRIHSVESTSAAGSGHPSSCSSMAETMSVLFFHTMRWAWELLPPKSFFEEKKYRTYARIGGILTPLSPDYGYCTFLRISLVEVSLIFFSKKIFSAWGTKCFWGKRPLKTPLNYRAALLFFQLKTWWRAHSAKLPSSVFRWLIPLFSRSQVRRERAARRGQRPIHPLQGPRRPHPLRRLGRGG